MKVVVREIRDEVVHGRILAAPFAEVLQLVVQIVGRLARQAREVIVVGTLAVRAVTGRAALHARFHRIGGLRLTLRFRSALDTRGADQQKGKQRAENAS